MINAFKIRKIAALALGGLLPVLFFVIGAQFYGFIIGIATLVVGLIMSYLAANMLLKNPFSDMLEGKGLLAFDINSTGVISPFIVSVVNNKVRFYDKKSGETIEDTFDRETVHMLNVPKKLQSSKTVVDGNDIYLKMNQDEFNKGRFSLYQYPVLLYDSLLKSVLTKDMLSENEKEAFAEHGILHLNHNIKDLGTNVRDFARGVVESLKPKANLFAQWWVWLIIGIVVLVIIGLFAPAVVNAIGGLGGDAAAQAIQTAGGAASNSGAVTPLG